MTRPMAILESYEGDIYLSISHSKITREIPRMHARIGDENMQV